MHFDLEFHVITRFGNNEDAINRENFLNILWRIFAREAGNLFQGYVDDKNSSKEKAARMKEDTEMSVKG